LVHSWAFSLDFCAWWPGVLVMIATGDAVVSLIQQLNANFLTEPWQQGVLIIAVIAFSFLLSVLRFRVTQNFVNVVFVAYGGAILLIGLAGLLSLGHPAAVDYSPHAWSPTWATATFYGTVILALLGIEVPLNMGIEITHPRSITRYLLWGSLVVIAAYLIGTVWRHGRRSRERPGQSISHRGSRNLRLWPGRRFPWRARQLHLYWLLHLQHRRL